MLKKRDAVLANADLNTPLSNIQTPETGNILLQSDLYVQLGCDLRDLDGLSRTLAQVVDIEKSIVMCTAEVSITYMDTTTADALVAWAGKLPDG
jgi:tRNA wybutosine-synthesizing protein 4